MKTKVLARVERTLVQRGRADGRQDAAVAARFVFERLEPRMMLSSSSGFGDGGQVSVFFPDGPRVDPSQPSFDRPESFPTATAAGPGGTIYVGGYEGGFLGATPDGWAIARLNADGTPDRTFAHGAGEEVVHVTGAEDGAPLTQILVQEDGKFIVTGGGLGGLIVARFNADGALDRSFNGGVERLPQIDGYDEAMLPMGSSAWLNADSSVTVVGVKQHSWSTQGNNRGIFTGEQDLVELRLLPNGRPDPTFGAGGIVSNVLHPDDEGDLFLSAAPLPGGGVVAYVNRSFASGVEVARLDSAGRLVSLTAAALSQDVSRGLSRATITPDGGAYVYAEYGGASIVRLLPDGTPDAAFGSGGVATLSPDDPPRDLSDLRVGADDSIWVVGFDGLFRLNSDGTETTGGDMFQVFGEALLTLPDGSIISADWSEASPHFAGFDLYKLLPDGRFAPSIQNNTPSGDSGDATIDPTAFFVPTDNIAFVGNSETLFTASPETSVLTPSDKFGIFDGD
jgi:uncharacterized delta-60 repeat protein